MIITAVYLFLFLIITITTMMAKAAENWCNLYKFTQRAMYSIPRDLADVRLEKKNKKKKKQYSYRFHQIFI
jgi:hypothetical protein